MEGCLQHQGGHYLQPHPRVFTSAGSVDVLVLAGLKLRRWRSQISNVSGQPQSLPDSCSRTTAGAQNLKATWCHSEPTCPGRSTCSWSMGCKQKYSKCAPWWLYRPRDGHQGPLMQTQGGNLYIKHDAVAQSTPRTRRLLRET